MTAYMLNLRDPDKTMLSAPGGKNVNLSELMRFANIIVPEGFSFIANAYQHTVFSNVRLNKTAGHCSLQRHDGRPVRSFIRRAT